MTYYPDTLCVQSVIWRPIAQYLSWTFPWNIRKFPLERLRNVYSRAKKMSGFLEYSTAMFSEYSCGTFQERLRRFYRYIASQNHDFYYNFIFSTLLIMSYPSFIKPDEVGKPIANETSQQLWHYEEFSTLYLTLIDRKPASFIILIWRVTLPFL